MKTYHPFSIPIENACSVFWIVLSKILITLTYNCFLITRRKIIDIQYICILKITLCAYWLMDNDWQMIFFFSAFLPNKKICVSFLASIIIFPWHVVIHRYLRHVLTNGFRQCILFLEGNIVFFLSIGMSIAKIEERKRFLYIYSCIGAFDKYKVYPV